MPRKKYAQKHGSDAATYPFVDAEEAWFWFIRCQKARRDGVQFEEGMARQARPCEPDDIFRWLIRLYRQGAIGGLHMEVLGRFGNMERPPDPRCREEEMAARLWDFALDRLTTVLQQKGMVECPEE